MKQAKCRLCLLPIAAADAFHRSNRLKHPSPWHQWCARTERVGIAEQWWWFALKTRSAREEVRRAGGHIVPSGRRACMAAAFAPWNRPDPPGGHQKPTKRREKRRPTKPGRRR
jgi:hypothetical protein